ncbi:hypothetical protein ColTof3_10530 [Colletotrichum tofieldiae]|nr:hypothetical protein ColTof3_10530 [Colletotrichum tofieldiae]
MAAGTGTGTGHWNRNRQEQDRNGYKMTSTERESERERSLGMAGWISTAQSEHYAQRRGGEMRQAQAARYLAGAGGTMYLFVARQKNTARQTEKERARSGKRQTGEASPDYGYLT